MKKISLSLFLSTIAVLSIISCKKSNSGGGSANSSTYVSSVISYAPQQKIVDSFYYNSTHLLDTFSMSVYDTTSGYPLLNNYTIQFLYQSPNTYPSWYYLYDVAYGNFGDYHLLSYDGSGRISKDTSLSGSGSVSYYSYPNNNVAVTYLPEGTPQNNQIDTFYITNGNVSMETIYTSIIPGQPDQQQADAQYTYSSVANPVWHATISDAIGPLLSNFTQYNNGGFIDFLSRNVLKLATGTETGGPATFSLSYTQTLDNENRLYKLTSPTAAADSIVFKYY
jgi:hypothetical protein